MPIPKKDKEDEEEDDALAVFLGRMVTDADKEADTGGTSASNLDFMDNFVYRPGPYNSNPDPPASVENEGDDNDNNDAEEKHVVAYDDVFKATSESPEGGGSLFDAPEKASFSFDALKTSEHDEVEAVEGSPAGSQHEAATSDEEEEPKQPIVPDAKAPEIHVKATKTYETMEWMEKFKKIGMKGQEQVTSVDDTGEIIQQGPPPQPFEYRFKNSDDEGEDDENDFMMPLSGHGDPPTAEDAEMQAAREIAGESATSFEEETVEETVNSDGDPIASGLLATLSAADRDNGVPPGEGAIEEMEFVTEDDDQQHEGEEMEEDETDSSVESGPIPEEIVEGEKEDLTSAYDPEAEYDASESSEDEDEEEEDEEDEAEEEETIEEEETVEEEVIVEEEFITDDMDEGMVLANVARSIEEAETLSPDLENQSQDVFLALDERSTQERQMEAAPLSPSVTKRDDSKRWSIYVLILAALLLTGVVAALIVMSQRQRQNPSSTQIPIETPAPSQESTITPMPTITQMPTGSSSSSPTQSPTITPRPTISPQSPTPPPIPPTALPTLAPVAPVAPPDNDTCEDAIGPVRSYGSSNFGTILGATADDVDRCGDVTDSGPGVWYNVLGTGGEMIAHTCQGTTFNSKITVFGSFCDKPVCIEANDNFCGENGQQSAVSWFSNYREEYQILLSGEPGFQDGSFDLVIAARANDECTTAIGPLSVGSPIPVMGNTLEATPNAIDCNGNVNDSPSVWYLVQGTGGQMTANLCDDTDFPVTIRILTGSCTGLECIAISSIIDCSITWDSTPFQDYYILISGLGADDVGIFSMSLTTTGLPDNDECQNALGPLAINGDPVMGSTDSATPDSTAPFCLSAVTANGVWYFLDGDGSFIQASLCDSASYDTRLSVYRGDCSNGDPSALECVEGNDDFCGAQSLVTWQALPGVRYYILVHGYAESSGNFLLSVTSL